MDRSGYLVKFLGRIGLVLGWMDWGECVFGWLKKDEGRGVFLVVFRLGCCCFCSYFGEEGEKGRDLIGSV